MVNFTAAIRFDAVVFIVNKHMHTYCENDDVQCEDQIYSLV